MYKSTNRIICAQLGHCIFCYSVCHEEILNNFNNFILASDVDGEILAVGEYEKKQYLKQFSTAKWDAYAEYKCLLNLSSDAMLMHDQLIFHSVAVLINDQVWLLSGPSGIGKSTQYRNLKKLYPDKIQIISGDNPVLAFEKNGIKVFPSPWNGKESWGSMLYGNLAGIILLHQAKENQIEPVSPQNAVIPVYNQINTYAKTEEKIHLLASLEERLITSVQIWSFENTGDLKSSQMLYEYIMNHQTRR